MRVVFLFFLVAFTVTTTAILVTYPPKGAKVDWSQPVIIKWRSVETDPTTFDLYVVNQAVNPSVSTLVASDVETSKGSYTIKANHKDLTSSDTGGGYQIDLKSSSGDGILAQSQQFQVTDGKAEFSSASSSGIDCCQYTFNVCFLDFFFDCFFHSCDYCSLLHHPHIYVYVDVCFYIYLYIVDIINISFYHYSYSYLYITFHYEDSYQSPYFHFFFYKHQYSWSVYETTSTTTETTTSTTKHTKTMETTSTPSASTTSNAAGLLMPPDQAGSLLLGLAILLL
ncbi:UPF0619 GPI-anchored membrane protein [Penicillium canariense]|uniref:UPF0619 GPI-anchored membrane protein n=1 Tax=Penicillium canariense TaxID=189055 RepID=A0A9W9I918_9EURO|nr:UPF0619 GPI-anchored membrane protein [Penicillium canariense]KAJ5168785.1 UPF0619 GPI-anchored membrane protein [Penicillium canariense]